MNITVSDIGTLRKQLTITIPADTLAERRNKLLERYAGSVQLKGFRPGKKPPRALLEKRLGPAVDDEASQNLIEEGFRQGIQENNLKPIGGITTDSSDRNNGITHVVSFEVRPDITLPAPGDIPVTIEDIQASDEDVESELADFAKRAGDYQDITGEEPLAEGDIATLSGSVSVDGSTVRDLHDLQHMLGSYPLLGLEPAEVLKTLGEKKVGDEASFTTTLPESFTPEEHVGKEASVAVTIQSARRLTPAPIDEDLAKRLGLESIDELRTRLRDMIQHRKQEELHNKQSDEVMDYLIANCQFDCPELLRESIIKQQREQKGDDATDEDINAEVDKDLRKHLLIEQIADDLQVEVTRQDVDQQIAMAAYQSGRKPEEVAKQLQESGRIQQVAAEIRSSKALGVFVESVVQAHSDTGSDSADEASADAETADAGDKE
ncbi:MAG: trigger factor [Planctomycetota bacterium]|nr:MAG: trigger factor [Planctomycetota bacterium]